MLPQTLIATIMDCTRIVRPYTSLSHAYLWLVVMRALVPWPVSGVEAPVCTWNLEPQKCPHTQGLYPPGACMHVCALSHLYDYLYVFAARLPQRWRTGALLCMSAAVHLNAYGAGEADQLG